ncbi:MAG: hypothetical protein ACI82F_004284 [Planctomycetota bacterium]|jgi:hypothetical protein
MAAGLSPYWALVHQSEWDGSSRTPAPSGSDRDRGRPTKLDHPVQDVAGDQRLHLPGLWVTSTKPPPDDRLVAEERVLDGALAVVTGLRLPLSPPN